MYENIQGENWNQNSSNCLQCIKTFFKTAIFEKIGTSFLSIFESENNNYFICTTLEISEYIHNHIKLTLPGCYLIKIIYHFWNVNI